MKNDIQHESFENIILANGMFPEGMNNTAQSSYDKRYGQHKSFKDMLGLKNIKSLACDLLELGDSNPVVRPECLDCNLVYNRLVYIKADGNNYLSLAGGDGDLLLMAKDKLTPANKVKLATWKLILGLSGDDNSISIFHPETDQFIIRLPNNKLRLLDAAVISGNDLLRQMATYRITTSINNTESTKGSVASIMPIRIGNENIIRVIGINGVVPHVVKLDDAKDFITGFEIVDNIDELPVITIPGSSVEGFQDYSNGPAKRCDKSSSKRMLAACVESGELSGEELDKRELFQDMTAEYKGPFAQDFNPETANVFQEHTGGEFNEILKSAYTKDLNKETIMDNVFYKLENAKLDPYIENLLEYNAERNKIYEDENADFESRITERIKKNTDLTDDLVFDMNNYRVKNMARDYFFLNDKLIKDRGANNSSN